jgi:hypothetical protein
LLRVVNSKLRGRALILIGTKTDLKTWDSVENALRLSFGDQRNLNCLEQDLITLFPFKGEQPLEFGKRIQIVRSKLGSKLNSIPENEMITATKNVYTNQYNTIAKHRKIKKPRFLRTRYDIRNRGRKFQIYPKFCNPIKELLLQILSEPIQDKSKTPRRGDAP